MSDSTFLETSRLLFRPHESGDEAAFVAMHTDDEFRRYVGGNAWPVEKARLRFHDRYVGRPADTFGIWATVLKENGEYIGMCGLAGDQIEPHLGYYIARSHWGRGLASEAARAFVDLGFEKLGLPEILADVERGNERSERILDELGFRFVREERIAPSGRIIDHYAIRSSH